MRMQEGEGGGQRVFPSSLDIPGTHSCCPGGRCVHCCLFPSQLHLSYFIKYFYVRCQPLHYEVMLC